MASSSPNFSLFGDNHTAGAFTVYAQRDQTRRTHLAELTHRLGLLGFDRAAFHAMVDWALPNAPSMRDPEAIGPALVEELRRRHILLPSLAVLELMVRTANARPRQSYIARSPKGFPGGHGSHSNGWLRLDPRQPRADLPGCARPLARRRRVTYLAWLNDCTSCVASAFLGHCKAPFRRLHSSASSLKPRE